ncbi:putative inner membrane protein [Escherichia coli]|uniref:Putative inner membrane protein n=1 Tax=Escherichia coli TaxID=562 RepID=A0A484X5E0_ECOLX|nr:putative inner membrane protein [Escherichia coli]
MVNVRQPRDVAQILLSVLFLAIMIVACLWIVQPFILGFAWAGTVVIATWPVLLRLQKIMFGRRSLAVLVMTLLLVMVFIIPIALLVNSIVDGSGPLIKAISSGDMTLPDLAWLNTIPVIGAKLYAGWHNLLDMGGDGDHGESPSLYWHHHHLVRWAGGAYRALYGALCADASLQRPAVLAR